MADGTWSGGSPYSILTNHDYGTCDSVLSKTPFNEVTTALFEVYLWQAFWPDVVDPTLEYSRNSPVSTSVQVRPEEIQVMFADEFGSDGVLGFCFAGFGVQCFMQSEVGDARVDPATRTYSSFARGANESATVATMIHTPHRFKLLSLFLNTTKFITTEIDQIQPGLRRTLQQAYQCT